jgi:peroxiredoxin family protein
MNVMERKKADAMPAVDEDRLRQLIDERIEAILEEKKKAKTPSLAIIATKGTLDMAYPPFILGSTAMALGWDVSIFFTFYGLELLKKDLELKVSPLGNPAMPMKMPMGPEWFKNIDWPVPNTIASNMPGFESAATALMEKTLETKGVASIATLREAYLDGGGELYACQMTVDLFGFEPDEFIPEIAGWIGAASYLPKSAEADISLFV